MATLFFIGVFTLIISGAAFIMAAIGNHERTGYVSFVFMAAGAYLVITAGIPLIC